MKTILKLLNTLMGSPAHCIVAPNPLEAALLFKYINYVFGTLGLRPSNGKKLEHLAYYESTSFCSLPFEPHWYKSLGKIIDEQLGLEALSEAYHNEKDNDVLSTLREMFNQEKITEVSKKYSALLDEAKFKEVLFRMETEEAHTLTAAYEYASADLYHKTRIMGVELDDLPEVEGLTASTHELFTWTQWYVQANEKIDPKDKEFLDMLEQWHAAGIFTAYFGQGFCVVCENPIRATKIYLGAEYPEKYDVEMEWGASSPHTTFKHKTWRDLEEEHEEDVYHTNVNQNALHSTVLLENAFKHGWKMVIGDKDPQDFKVKDNTVSIGERSFHIVLDNYYPNEEAFRVLLKEGETKVYLDMKHSSGLWSGKMEWFVGKEDAQFRLVRI